MPEKPNIVIILTDQQSSHMMSCAGNSDVSTPALDNLANSGARFINAVCNNPVCVPSRFSLFTGKRPEVIGMRCNEDARKIAPIDTSILKNGMGYLFQRGGYQTFYGGKEHLPRFRAKDIGFTYLEKDEREGLSKYAAQFLAQKHEAPFVLVVSLINPHDICYMAINAYKSQLSKWQQWKLKLEGWWKKIEVKNVLSFLRDVDDPTSHSSLPKLPENHSPQVDEPEAVRSLFKRRFRKYVRDAWSDLEWRKHRYVYAKLTELVDSEIGTVLDGLYNGPNKDNTIVLFTSDHGDHDSAHGLEHKTALFSEAVRIPLLMSWPGHIIPKSIIPHIVANGLDLIPTLCDIIGIPIPKDLEGQSFLPLVTDQSISNPLSKTINDPTRLRWVPVESEVGRALWSERWVYVQYDFGEHAEQLYDLQNDPGQTYNHLSDFPEIVAFCRNEYLKYW